MTKAVKFDYSKALAFIGQHEIDYLASRSVRPMSSYITEQEQARTIWAGSICQQL